MKPNIIIVVVDSMRADHVGAYGYAKPTTPNIDRLAAEGCVFETAITAAPFSPASYASIFSNLYPHQHGVNGDTVRVWPDHFTRLAEKMRDRGYFTFGVSNNDFVSTRCNAAQGFAEFNDAYESGFWSRQQERVLRRVRKYLGEEAARKLTTNSVRCAPKGDSMRSIRIATDAIRRANAPFFGFVVLMDPHAPFDRRYTKFVSDKDAASRFFQSHNGGSMWVECMAKRKPLADELLTAAHELYDSHIHHADHCVGLLCDELRNADVLDETVLMVTADHGEAFGEQGVWGHGFSLNDCLTRVPLVVRAPNILPAGIRSKALVQLHDMHETCLSVSSDGHEQTEACPNTLTQASDPAWCGRQHAFSEFPQQSGTLSLMRKLNPELAVGRWDHPLWSVRTSQWRYTQFGDGESELFDLTSDLGETRCVADQNPDVCEELRSALVAHRSAQPFGAGDGASDEPEAVDERVMERLRALGYVE